MIAPACYRRNDVALIAKRLMSMGRAPQSELEAYLPLNDAAYLALLALARKSDRGFFAIFEATLSAIRLTPGELATALDRLVELGLVAQTDGSDGERHAVTELGDAVLIAEAGRRRRRFDPPAMPTLQLLSARVG
jgi:DNA-binding MarR family transcriptional regulator